MNITKSLKFGFLFCRVLPLAFFSCLFLFFFLLIWFVFLQLLAIEKRLAIFSGRQQISLKSPTMRLTKVRHGRLNRQNRNKMGEDRERELTANHQQFNKWIQQIIGFLTSGFFFKKFLISAKNYYQSLGESYRRIFSRNNFFLSQLLVRFQANKRTHSVGHWLLKIWWF